MNTKPRNIILLVIAVLAAVFAYQCWWLMKLYHEETTQQQRYIQRAVVQADFFGLDLRIRDLKKAHGEHGNVSVSAWAAYDDSDSNYVETMTRREVGDSLYIDVQRRKIDEQEQQKMKEHPVREFFRPLEADSLLTRENPMLAMSYTVQRALHKSLQEVSLPNLVRYDSLLTALLRENDIEAPHRVTLTGDDGSVLDSVSTAGYTPSPHAEEYVYYTTPTSFAAYHLTIEPVRNLVLRQMTGILAASAILLLVLSLTLWYLVRTLMRLRTLDEMKTDFTNNMTHELKTPISVAYAAGDALLHFGSLPPKAQSYLTVSQEQLIRLSGMVEQILAMSTERRRAIPLQLADVGLRKVAEPLMEMHRLKSQRPVDFTLDIEPDDLTLRADSDHLTAMLSNLIDNAIKYSRGERAEVTIRGRRNVVEVIDHGVGIPHDKLPYVFDRFYRVPQGDRHDVKGYGLGLYYVRQTMLRHGGDVTIKSTPGQGTTVKLQFDGTD